MDGLMGDIQKVISSQKKYDQGLEAETPDIDLAAKPFQSKATMHSGVINSKKYSDNHLSESHGQPGPDPSGKSNFSPPKNPKDAEPGIPNGHAPPKVRGTAYDDDILSSMTQDLGLLGTEEFAFLSKLKDSFQNIEEVSRQSLKKSVGSKKQQITLVDDIVSTTESYNGTKGQLANQKFDVNNNNNCQKIEVLNENSMQHLSYGVSSKDSGVCKQGSSTKGYQGAPQIKGSYGGNISPGTKGTGNHNNSPNNNNIYTRPRKPSSYFSNTLDDIKKDQDEQQWHSTQDSQPARPQGEQFIMNPNGQKETFYGDPNLSFGLDQIEIPRDSDRNRTNQQQQVSKKLFDHKTPNNIDIDCIDSNSKYSPGKSPEKSQFHSKVPQIQGFESVFASSQKNPETSTGKKSFYSKKSDQKDAAPEEDGYNQDRNETSQDSFVYENQVENEGSDTSSPQFKAVKEEINMHESRIQELMNKFEQTQNINPKTFKYSNDNYDESGYNRPNKANGGFQIEYDYDQGTGTGPNESVIFASLNI
jgi:hypothetical protein